MDTDKTKQVASLSELLEIVYRIVHDVCQMIFHLFDIHFNVSEVLFCLLDIELGDFADRLLTECQHMVTGNFLFEQWPIRVKRPFDIVNLDVPAFGVFF